MSGTAQRRICWPDPDWCCLEGGCGYCNYEGWRSIEGIRQYAQRHKLMKHYNYGRDTGWPNIDQRVKPEPKKKESNDE